MIVRVGSANPMKLRASKAAFARFYKSVEISGVDVRSGVRAQPLSFGEIAKGARQRARGAFDGCDLSVGIEAGIFRLKGLSPRPFQITLACVFDGKTESLGAGPFYEVPPAMVAQVVAADTGSVAVVTKGKVTREAVTRDAVLMALAPFVSRELYEGF